MADVFLSYAREDRERADKIARAFSARGLDVFWDSEIPPGRTWADYTEQKLAASKALIVLWTAHSVKSQWVREEARMGRDRGILIPVMLDGTPAPFGFGELQAANLSTWRGDAKHPEFVRFVNAVEATARKGEPAHASPQPQPAPQPAMSFAPRSNGVGPEASSALDYVRKCLRMYADANGRAGRAEYWWWVLFNVLVQLVAYALDIAAGTQLIVVVAMLALAAPSVCVAIRRLHDLDYSGRWLLAFLGAVFVSSLIAGAVPALGGFLVLGVMAATLFVLATPSKPGANVYGPNPLGH